MKNLLNLGKPLNRNEQKQVFGGDDVIKDKNDPRDCYNSPYGCCSDDMDCRYMAPPAVHGTCGSDGYCYY
ncbi:hypothetical protein [Winogradskyella sp. SYSU M77433]|uniref:hypothetical protein n=1 Tax=Winogradskyella sp. SYSU M77433 TaxID=3042722 RepID=UPI002480A649|nr:hypothetical protein [Winogradskyella sp. SYSU M77433]MDH7914582.1 hypothetical protein [Winogradskyella sp. SYSU M77433]